MNRTGIIVMKIQINTPLADLNNWTSEGLFFRHLNRENKGCFFLDIFRFYKNISTKGVGLFPNDS